MVKQIISINQLRFEEIKNTAKTELPKLFNNFLDFEAITPTNVAFILESGEEVTYAQLIHRVNTFSAALPTSRSLILIEVENNIQTLCAYLGALRAGHVVMLMATERPEDIANVKSIYSPNWVFAKKDGAWTLVEHSSQALDLHEDLAVMLATSGSTGSAKFVRLSYMNIFSNAASIAEYLHIQADDRALMTLPFHYSYGLSVVHSHLLMGACLLVTSDSVTSAGVWKFFNRHHGTSFAGVPYVFELLDRIGFKGLELPSLRTITQAGGRLHRDKVLDYARWAKSKGISFYVMYGQTEATARMSYVPPDRLIQYPDVIGVAIPAGKLRILDEAGNEILTPDTEGEIYYEGPNVMMGYALGRNDLALPDMTTRLATGDLGCFNHEGLFRVTGRKSRFVKIYGLRIALDELETGLNKQGYKTVCSGTDDGLVLLVLDHDVTASLQQIVANQCKIPSGKILVKEVSEFPLLPSGKVDYATIKNMVVAEREDNNTAKLAQTLNEQNKSIRHLYRDVFVKPEIKPTDSFVSLGGDSLSYVQASVGIEKILGHLPDNWERLSVTQLERVKPTSSWLHSLDITSLIRAIAIIEIIALHLLLSPVVGGAYLLLMVAGFNLSRFQLGKVFESNSAWPVYKLALKVYVPCVLIIGVRQISHQAFFPSNFFMVAMLVDNRDYYFILLWFIEALLQTLLLLAILLSFKPVRDLARNDSFRFGLVGAFMLVMLGYLIRVIFDSDTGIEAGLRYQSYSVAWMVFLGLAMFYANTARQKALTIVSAIAMWTIFIAHSDIDLFHRVSNSIVLLLGICGLLYLKKVRVPSLLAGVLGKIGAASMFIYMTQFIVQQNFEKLFGPIHPEVHLVLTLIGGVLIWMLWESLVKLTLAVKSLLLKQQKP